MSRCTYALCRAAMTFAMPAAAAVLAGGLVLGPGLAGATTAPTGSISATSSPPVPSTGHGLAAGSLKITLSAAGGLATGGELSLFATSASGTVHWSNYTVAVSGGISYTSTMHVGNALNIHLGAKATTRGATIYVTGIEFTTAFASGHVAVSVTLNGVTFSPSTAIDGTIVQTPPNAPTIEITARSQPAVAVGATYAAAGEWTVTMSGDVTTGNGWTAGAILTISVAPPSGNNCVGLGYLYFAGTPAITISGATGTSGSSTVSASIASSGTCAVTQPNDLKLTFDTSDYFDTTIRGTVTATISGVHFAVGTTAAATGTGGVVVTAAFSGTPATVSTTRASNANVEVTTQMATSPSGGTGGTGGTPAQSGTSLAVKADTPPVTMRQDAYAATISPVDVLGTSSAHVPAGYVCLTLEAGAFNTAAVPSVDIVSGNGSASPNASYQADNATGAETVVFQVSKPSTTGDEYEVSALSVNAPTTTGPVTVTVTYGSSSTCAKNSGRVGSATAFAVTSTPVTRIYGATPDATAAAELEHQFNAQATDCPGRSGARPVVLATDGGYPDALASAYLAGSLGTGELLTPTLSLSAATANAIRVEGITHVYIVGGPLAVSTGVSQQLESMLAYNCGGTTPLTSAGSVHLEVTRIAGMTEYDTAQWVAEYPSAGTVGTLDAAGAYGGTNRSGGVGKYNDTAGNGTAAPETLSTLPTAIVATGRTYQDAESASVLSYADHFPILLTTPTSLSPQVSSAVSDLGIKQVIVMGGPLAVADTVVSSLQSSGISVLRIAGQRATDTAVQLADFELGSAAGHLGAGWNGSGEVSVARGDYFTDGLAGAVVAAGAGRSHSHEPEPLLLCTDPSTIGQYLSAFLAVAGRTGIDRNSADRVSALTILGGPKAVSPSIVTTMVSDL